MTELTNDELNLVHGGKIDTRTTLLTEPACIPGVLSVASTADRPDFMTYPFAQ